MVYRIQGLLLDLCHDPCLLDDPYRRDTDLGSVSGRRHDPYLDLGDDLDRPCDRSKRGPDRRDPDVPAPAPDRVRFRIRPYRRRPRTSEVSDHPSGNRIPSSPCPSPARDPNRPGRDPWYLDRPGIVTFPEGIRRDPDHGSSSNRSADPTGYPGRPGSAGCRSATPPGPDPGLDRRDPDHDGHGSSRGLGHDLDPGHGHGRGRGRGLDPARDPPLRRPEASCPSLGASQRVSDRVCPGCPIRSFHFSRWAAGVTTRSRGHLRATSYQSLLLNSLQKEDRISEDISFAEQCSHSV